jgi:hypothetical protein
MNILDQILTIDWLVKNHTWNETTNQIRSSVRRKVELKQFIEIVKIIKNQVREQSYG